MSTPLPSMAPLPDPEVATEASASDPASPNSSLWRRILVFALMVGVGVVGGMLISSGLSGGVDLGQFTLAEKLLLIVSLPVGMLLIVAIHEGGHTLAGYLMGFRLQHISVGPLKLQRTPGGWKALRSQNEFFGGMSHSVPGPNLQDVSISTVRRGRAVRLVGGAAANMLSGGLAVGLALTVPLGGETMEAAVFLLGIASLCMGVINLIPFRTGSGLISDGARLLLILRGTPEANRDIALATIRAEAYGGTRPSNWSPRWVERMLTPRDHGMTDGSTRMLAYRHTLDGGRTEDARDHLAEALHLLDRLPKAQHAGLMVEAAYFEAAHRGDAENARAWLQCAGSGSHGLPAGVPTCAAKRAMAATLFAEGQHEEAHCRISEAEAALSEHPVSGTAVAERAWLHDLASRMPSTS